MEAARSLDPLVRREIDAATGDEAILLQHMADRGPSVAEDIQLELGWDRQRLKRVRGRLEKVGAVISEGLVFEDLETWRFAPMRRWDQVVAPAPGVGDPYGEAVLAGVKAAVLTPEANIRSWFTWSIPDHAVQRLVDGGRLIRPAPGLLALTE
jgi:hypothetical protein